MFVKKSVHSQRVDGSFFRKWQFLLKRKLPYSTYLKGKRGWGVEGFAAVVSVMPNFLVKHRCCLPSLETEYGQIGLSALLTLCRKVVGSYYPPCNRKRVQWHCHTVQPVHAMFIKKRVHPRTVGGSFFRVKRKLPYSKYLKWKREWGLERFAAVVSVMPDLLVKHRCCCLPSIEMEDGEIALSALLTLCRKVVGSYYPPCNHKRVQCHAVQPVYVMVIKKSIHP